MSNITGQFTINTDDIVYSLDQESAMELIKRIDLEMADYEFTESLAKYLIQQLRLEHTEEDPFDIMELVDDCTPTFDLDLLDWQRIKIAASESKWIPEEYYQNDWVYDVCMFLKGE